MRDNFIFYCKSFGKQWYMCIDCGYKEGSKPLVCPVCNNKQKNEELKNAVRQAVEVMISQRTKK